MTYIAIDTETTGPDPDECSLVEIGMYGKGVQSSHLVDPGVDIPPSASAVHHITNNHVQGCDSPDVVISGLMNHGRFHPEDTLIAHNAKFDRPVLERAGVPDHLNWICTYKVAMVAWPEAPAHNLQTLRYWRGLDDPPEDMGHPHRALYDAFCCYHLWEELSKDVPVHDMLDITANPILLPNVRFGKHQGKAFKDVPKGYLEWITGQDFDEDVMFTAKHWLEQ